MATAASLEQRVAHLEGAYQHLATKADLHELEVRIETKLHVMESRLLRWVVGTLLASVGITAGMASGITLALNRLLNG
ncbi:MAG: hypothetical protein OXL97_08560 [Chloroflexota bacterium]|nr:hypothetical protein [Chloroflexota bacterium]MDE2885533.1 hypothetical protein [Chloroflexota bacterium]